MRTNTSRIADGWQDAVEGAATGAAIGAGSVVGGAGGGVVTTGAGAVVGGAGAVVRGVAALVGAAVRPTDAPQEIRIGSDNSRTILPRTAPNSALGVGTLSVVF